MVFGFYSPSHCCFLFLTFASFIDSSNWNLFTELISENPHTDAEKKHYIAADIGRETENRKRISTNITQMYWLCVYFDLTLGHEKSILLIFFDKDTTMIHQCEKKESSSRSKRCRQTCSVCTVNNRLQIIIKIHICMRYLESNAHNQNDSDNDDVSKNTYRSICRRGYKYTHATSNAHVHVHFDTPCIHLKCVRFAHFHSYFYEIL